MFKNIRILILLSILLVVAIGVYQDKNQDWQKPVYVILHPINADNSPDTQRYIDNLSPDDFKQIDQYMTAQSARYGKPVRMYYKLGSTIKALPPAVPKNGSVLDIMMWSLKFRYYAYKYAKSDIPPSLTLFLQYYDANKNTRLTHMSTALENGRIGVANLFASDKKGENNNVVIAHESLHGFGATDKYDLSTGLAISPIGYPNPNQINYPQKQAELMAMHIMTSPNEFVMARKINDTLVNEITAREIGWQK